MNDKRRQTSNPKQFDERYLNNYSFDIDNFRIDENEERGMFRYSFQFENAPGGNAIGDKIIFNPLFFTQNKTPMRSEERRVGKECSSRWFTYLYRKKKKQKQLVNKKYETKKKS